MSKKNNFSGILVFGAALALTFAACLCASVGYAADLGQVMAGAMEVDITPKVLGYEDLNGNGRFDMGDSSRPFKLGDRVLTFEEGKILVGNGSGEAWYVHGPLKASVLVLEDPKTQIRVAFVSADLYLFLQQDVDAIRAMVGPSAGIDFITIAPTHNHMGPDTVGMMGLDGKSVGELLEIIFAGGEAQSGINPVWFEGMMRKIAGAIEAAAANMYPANLRLGKTKFSFGMMDNREPHIIDDDLMVMSLEGLNGQPIATLVQGTCHPESVLLYADPKYSLLDVDKLAPNVRKAQGHILSPGFPGALRTYIRENGGGTPLYFSGALGGMITNIWTKVWDPEKHPEYPVNADPETVPENIKIPPDFRLPAVQGREMAKAAFKALAEGETAKNVDISFEKKNILVPMENPVFRLMSASGILGYKPGVLYDDEGRPDRRTGRWLKGAFISGLQVPKGKNIKTEVSVVNVGPAQVVSVPGEILGELSAGFPDDFETNTKKYYPKNAKHHPTGADYKLAFPPIKKQTTRPYPFVFSLSAMDMGYIIPRSDFDPPHDIPIPPVAAWWFCFDSSSNPHYEESMTLSSEIEFRVMGAVTDILSRQKACENGEKD